ncbi:tRNA 5-methoxyuridine(34)/uridine 5-oxyacetic acid(34) synthase CmoB [Helicobacter pylori]|uniref:tRNA 5-methoxyuridine(34)/uridine 5-oxyacetic acid(34) synthase CmoB n=1 Tax=Helicobacter pylori TaxID=210 RepID=UPI0011262358|nr:tRNA 5-methoxyuridine(34)/uridine 5-oxyacetic acid(34) synthase CmoB [Helicobacter pylori]TPH90869.1 tRNA 5-methoxyuridine(34)/uridine 5-oxyacetic acid(34) synthase CmoB [Helicobacter pylori]
MLICNDKSDPKTLLEEIMALRPWRKGPFEISQIKIDSEWDSSIKWDLVKNATPLKDKVVADVGCNNGYYLFKMLEHGPKSLVGFDPGVLVKKQFEFLAPFFDKEKKIIYESLGVEDLHEKYPNAFDVIFCLGVLYHRKSPLETLKALYHALKIKGELVLDTLIIDSPLDIALCPKKTYAKMKNVYFIPSVSTLKGWCERVGFENFEVLSVSKTTPKEQRKTDFILGQSLEDFLDKTDPSKTLEGYDAPLRGYFKMLKPSKR